MLKLKGKFYSETPLRYRAFYMLWLSHSSWFVIVVPKYLNCATLSKHPLAIFMSWFCPAFWWWDSNIYLIHIQVHQFLLLKTVYRDTKLIHLSPLLAFSAVMQDGYCFWGLKSTIHTLWNTHQMIWKQTCSQD
jgi:hypothetical protein